MTFFWINTKVTCLAIVRGDYSLVDENKYKNPQPEIIQRVRERLWNIHSCMGHFHQIPLLGPQRNLWKKRQKSVGTSSVTVFQLLWRDIRTCRGRLLFITGCPDSKYHRESILISTLLGQLLRHIPGKLLILKLTHSY